MSWWSILGGLSAAGVRFAWHRRRGTPSLLGRLYTWTRHQARLNWELADLRDRNALLTIERDWWRAEATARNQPDASAAGSRAGRGSTAMTPRGRGPRSKRGSSVRSGAPGPTSRGSRKS